VSDHRIRLTLNKLDRIIGGDLSELITALRTHRQAALLQAAGGDASPPSPDGRDDGTSAASPRRGQHLGEDED
jgi:hypothetical protein